MTDREAFEKSIIQERPGLSIMKYENGPYCDWNTQSAWESWQAACKYKDGQEVVKG